MTTTKTTSIRLMDPPERGLDEFTSLGEHSRLAGHRGPLVTG